MEENKLTPFTDAPDTAVITCCHVTDDGAPVLYVSHDEDDGMWQFFVEESIRKMKQESSL